MITFRGLERRDFTMLARWLAEPLVARWWNHEWTQAAIERDFGPSIDGTDPTEICVATVEDTPFGLIQRYRIDDNPEYADELAGVCQISAGALSIDYLIGEASFRGRGLGTEMIRTFVAASWGRYPDASDVVVPVSVANRSSWMALERAGFQRVATGELTPDNPIDSREHVVYRFTR